MPRLLLTLTLLLTAGAASAGEVRIAWFGQSMFEIVTPRGTRIVTDPHNIEAFRVKPVRADLVLMSHLHSDHTQLVSIENAKEAIQYNALKKSGADGLVIDWNVVDETVKDVRIESIPCYHDAMSGLQRGKNGIWVIDVDGLRIAHLGDLGHLLTKAQLKKLGAVDVLMVPVGGVYTLNGLEAYKVVEQIKPKRYILPMHYGNIIYDELLPVKTFQDECVDAEIPVQTMKPGEVLKIDSKAAVPAKPTLAILHYLSGGLEIKKPKK